MHATIFLDALDKVLVAGGCPSMMTIGDQRVRRFIDVVLWWFAGSAEERTGQLVARTHSIADEISLDEAMEGDLNAETGRTTMPIDYLLIGLLSRACVDYFDTVRQEWYSGLLYDRDEDWRKGGHKIENDAMRALGCVLVALKAAVDLIEEHDDVDLSGTIGFDTDSGYEQLFPDLSKGLRAVYPTYRDTDRDGRRAWFHRALREFLRY